MSGEYGILMGNKSKWGQGYGNETSKLVLNYCFNNLGFKQIILGIKKANLNNIKL